jgi:P-type E1-E2 ATPase
MIELSIPGNGTVRLEHLVCDVNGTLAVDGRLVDGVSGIIGRLKDRLEIHLLTADTFGRQSIIDQQLNLTAVRLQPGDEAEQKANYVQQLGPERVIAIGQGANDALMLRSARIGVCVLSSEGAAVETLMSADITAPGILTALEMLEKPLRLVATLRK